MRRILSSVRTSSPGSAVVEVAFLLSFLLLVLFGIIDFGRALWHSNVLHTACREGARVMAVTDAPSDSAKVLQRINDVLSTAGIVPDPGDVRLTWPPDPNAEIRPVTVEITHDFDLFAGPILGVIPGTVPLSARGVRRNE